MGKIKVTSFICKKCDANCINVKNINGVCPECFKRDNSE